MEVFSAVRGRWLCQKISEKRAEDALSAMVTTIDLVAAGPLLTRMWELRKQRLGLRRRLPGRCRDLRLPAGDC